MQRIILPIIVMLILAWVIRHNIKRNTSKDHQSVKNYLAKEDEANSTRRKDISSLPYITVPLETLPLDITLNDEKKQLQIAEYIKEIHALSDKKMLNLIGISNTELKATYGPANLEVLTLYDQTYSKYIRTLHLFADCIYEEHPDKAAAILEYCLSIGTDISGSYELLGKYYLNKNDVTHFEALYQYIPDSESISGKMIVNKLEHLRNSK